MKINTEKFEKTLVKNWTEFVDVREFMSHVRTLAVNHLNLSENSKVTQLSISRFELGRQGFIVWIEYILTQYDTGVNRDIAITSELILDCFGTFHHVKSIINP